MQGDEKGPQERGQVVVWVIHYIYKKKAFELFYPRLATKVVRFMVMIKKVIQIDYFASFIDALFYYHLYTTHNTQVFCLSL